MSGSTLHMCGIGDMTQGQLLKAVAELYPAHALDVIAALIVRSQQAVMVERSRAARRAGTLDRDARIYELRKAGKPTSVIRQSLRNEGIRLSVSQINRVLKNADPLAAGSTEISLHG